MTDIYCDCPYPELCKHEVAAAFTLRMLFEQPQFKDISDFMAMDHRAFWQLAARTDSICLLFCCGKTGCAAVSSLLQ